MSVLYHYDFIINVFNNTEGNCLCSPNNCFSFIQTLSEGCDETSREYIKSFFSWDKEKFGKSFDLYDHKLKKLTKLFTRKESVLSNKIKNNLLEKLGCDIEEIDLNTDCALAIQEYESEKEILENSANLINRINLDLEWDKNLTRESTTRQFSQNAEQTSNADFVEFTGKFGYGETEALNAKIVEVPLENEDLKLVFILPNNPDELGDLEYRINADVLSELKQCRMNLSIPKFKHQQDFDLKEFLQQEDSYRFCSCYSTGVMKVTSAIEFSENGIKASASSGCELILGPIIKEIIYETEIANRFAKTVITSTVANYQNYPQETNFDVVLPEDAFITEFIMEIEGKAYKSYVKEKQEAKEIYEAAIASGKGAAQVAVNARDSNRFAISLNIQPLSEVKFLLTFEELLHRRNDRYEFVLNVQPGQLVKLMNVIVNINESRNLKFVKTPAVRSGNQITKDEEQTSLSNIEFSESNAVVKFELAVDKQEQIATKLGTEDLQGQFVVQYDVEVDPTNGEVLISDGYFVHFFAPDDLPPLAKHVVFALDTSGSMRGRKINQLKVAMRCILEQIRKTDLLDISEFTDTVSVHDIDSKTRIVIDYDQDDNYYDPFPRCDRMCIPSAKPANDDIIEKAQTIVYRMNATSSTHMIAGLETALFLVKRGQEQYSNYQPIVIFLTDGRPTDGITEDDEIIKIVTELNSNYKAAIFGLSFGNDADKNFLRRLSLSNFGFSRHIYEAADASLQLQQFYQEISSPLLSNVIFKYDCNLQDVTKTDFPIYFKGSDIVICGKHASPEVISTVNLYRQGECVELKPPVKNSSTQIERLWAYLTIKQLLEQRESAGDKSELTKKALELAMKYSFVTEVTSLVVVKPDESSAVDTENVSVEATPEDNENVVCGYGKKKCIKKRCLRKNVDVITVEENLENAPLVEVGKLDKEKEEPTMDFVLNRPFLMMVQLKIEEKFVILFMGRITNCQ